MKPLDLFLLFQEEGIKELLCEEKSSLARCVKFDKRTKTGSEKLVLKKTKKKKKKSFSLRQRGNLHVILRLTKRKLCLYVVRKREEGEG